MIRYKHILSMIACGTFLAAQVSCSNEDYLGGHFVTSGAGVKMNVTGEIKSATDPTLAWTSGQQIGISTGYAQYDATARNRNYVCQTDGKTFEQSEGLPIYVKGHTNIVAYYPFTGVDGAEASISLDTRNQQQITDYLFAKAENVSPQNGTDVNLQFDYALARLNMALSVPQGEQITSCKLTGFAQQATVDPYSLDMTLEAPEELVFKGDDVKEVAFKLIPQTVSENASVPARLVLVGNIRSYSIDMSGILLSAGVTIDQTIDVTKGISTIELVPGGAAWQPCTISGNCASAALEKEFLLSDRAGLYVVKNGQVLKSNIPLTYNANGFWEPEETIEASSMEGAQYYAYYPYNASMQFDATSATPFATAVAAMKPAAKQNTKSDYEVADIMVTSALSIGQLNSVKLPFNHQKAMVCVELPNSSYIFDNDGMAPYVLAKAENARFTLDGTTVQPYFDDATQTYRLIVEPGQATTLTVTYTNNGVEQSFETSSLSQLQAGQYAHFVVDGGASLVNMTLAPGDYYCADGRIVKGDASPLPSNIVGVVFKVGTSDAIRSANSAWCHAVVISTADVKAKWGNDKSTTSEQNAAGWRYWFRDYNLNDQNGQTNAGKLDESIMAEEGFEVTKAWLAVPQPLTIGGITLDYTSLMRETYTAWVEEHRIPDNVNTGWYVPSLGDWHNIESQLSVIDSRMEAVGSTTLAVANHWSCNVRGAGSNWCYVVTKTAQSDRYKGVACNGSALYRFLLAF